MIHYSLLIKKSIMSQKRKLQRARYAAKEEEKGKSIVKWIFGCLVALAVIYMIYIVYTMS